MSHSLLSIELRSVFVLSVVAVVLCDAVRSFTGLTEDCFFGRFNLAAESGGDI